MYILLQGNGYLQDRYNQPDSCLFSFGHVPWYEPSTGHGYLHRYDSGYSTSFGTSVSSHQRPVGHGFTTTRHQPVEYVSQDVFCSTGHSQDPDRYKSDGHNFSTSVYSQNRTSELDSVSQLCKPHANRTCGFPENLTLKQHVSQQYSQDPDRYKSVGDSISTRVYSQNRPSELKYVSQQYKPHAHTHELSESPPKHVTTSGQRCQKCNEFYANEEYGSMCSGCFKKLTIEESVPLRSPPIMSTRQNRKHKRVSLDSYHH